MLLYHWHQSFSSSLPIDCQSSVFSVSRDVWSESLRRAEIETPDRQERLFPEPISSRSNVNFQFAFRRCFWVHTALIKDDDEFSTSLGKGVQFTLLKKGVCLKISFEDWSDTKFGWMPASDQLRAHPSLNPHLTLACYHDISADCCLAGGGEGRGRRRAVAQVQILKFYMKHTEKVIIWRIVNYGFERGL